MKNEHYIKYLSIIFFTGAVVLSLELLASRILTPFFGVSLYIWTSILSVTLVFLAIGYQFGGWITSKIDSKYYEELFIFIPFVSSVFILLSTITYPILLPKLINLDLLVGSFIGSFIFSYAYLRPNGFMQTIALHSIAGIAIFASGLGWLFYSGGNLAQ